MDAAANRSLDSAWSLDLHLILHCPTLSPESTLSLHWVYTLLSCSPCPPLPIAKPLLLLSHGGSKTTTSKPLSGQSSKMRLPEKTSSCASQFHLFQILLLCETILRIGEWVRMSAFHNSDYPQTMEGIVVELLCFRNCLMKGCLMRSCLWPGGVVGCPGPLQWDKLGIWTMTTSWLCITLLPRFQSLFRPQIST